MPLYPIAILGQLLTRSQNIFPQSFILSFLSEDFFKLFHSFFAQRGFKMAAKLASGLFTWLPATTANPRPFCQPHSVISHVDTRWRRCLRNRFPMTATYNSLPSQVQSHSNPRGSKMAAFAEPVLFLTAQLPLQLCTHHAPPSPVPIQPRESKMAAVFAEPFSV